MTRGTHGRNVGRMTPPRVLLRALAVAAIVLPLSAPGIANARSHPQLTVMTRNLYLGSDLSPATSATTPFGFLSGVATIYGRMLFTDFPTRAGALAAEVAADHPDLIGLQEVSTWTTAGPTAGPSLDFLAILQQQLLARGLHYDVAAVSHNADISAPLASPCDGPLFSCSLRFQDRDVILVNHDRAGLSVGNARTGRYAAQVVLATPVGPLSFDRGWATVDAVLDGRAFRFADTHLETEDAPAVQEAQGREFLAAVRTKGAVVAVGDFNSASDGSTTTTYADLTSDWFRDGAADVGATCCQGGLLVNPTSALTTRIDLVLAHGPVQPRSARRIGATPFQASPPLWPSDHAGVVATLRLP